MRLWIATYSAVMLIGGALFGHAFHENADPFEVYSSLVARLSVWGRRDGALVVRSPLANLNTTPARPGLVAVVSVLFGSTAFDSFQESSAWVTRTQASDAPQLLDNLALRDSAWWSGCSSRPARWRPASDPTIRRTQLPTLFAHSMVPIVCGYVVAHYLTYLVVVGQSTLIQMSDPHVRREQPVRHRRLVDELLAGRPSDACWRAPRCSPWCWATSSAWSRRTTGRSRCCRRGTSSPVSCRCLFAMIAFTVGGLYLLFAA